MSLFHLRFDGRFYLTRNHEILAVDVADILVEIELDCRPSADQLAPMDARLHTRLCSFCHG